MKRTPIEIEEKICKDYSTEEYSPSQLSIKYNVSKATVLKILHRNNVLVTNKRLKNEELKADYFKEINTEEKAYYLGFIFADGSISEYGFSISINEKDSYLLDNFRKAINSKGVITTSIRGKSSMSRFVINGKKHKKFYDNLNKYGIVPNKTKNTFHLPYEKIPKKYWKDFLRGLIDGDGWVIKTAENRYKIGFVTQYETTAEDFVFMINEIIEEKWNNKILTPKNKYAVVQFQKYSIVKQIATVLYADNNICLSRKFRIAQEIIDSKR